MKLLVVTQTIDKEDKTLGFFHDWVSELAKKCEKVSVICLYRGRTDLPENVFVYSLGKESGASRTKYLVKLFSYIWKYRGDYDEVFVHMNQEYVLFGGLIWKILGKKIFFWRNHPRGSLLTFLAVALSTKVFCTSSSSFTARFKKTSLQPAGVNTRLFRPAMGVARAKYSVCMVGRISPIKHIFEGLEAVRFMVESGEQVSLVIVGNVGEKIEDKEYLIKLQSYISENNLHSYVRFEPAILTEDLPRLYSSYEVCLNLTDEGSFDKTIVEAAACGAVPVVSNKSLSKFLPEECVTDRKIDGIVSAIRKMFQPQNRLKLQDKLVEFVKSQSLESLVKNLGREMNF